MAQSTPQDERRASERFDCPNLHLIVAPYTEGRLPRSDEFTRVRASNLSSGGMAFFYPTTPNFGDVVLGIGGPPPTVFVVARVIFHGPDLNSTDHLIRCTFVQRLGAHKE